MTSENLKIAINGFGRIGRSILRALMSTRQAAEVDVVLINDVAPLKTCAYLFEYDSIFGPFKGCVETSGEYLIIEGRKILVHNQPDLGQVDLSGIDLVLECTGRAKSRALAEAGLKAGAKAVLISGPSNAAEATIVLGANDDLLQDQRIISNASCTTHALAPILRVLDHVFGIQATHATTIHCYTASQPTVDTPRGDLARSRAAALSMVPTTTSATRLIEHVLPHLAGRITGAAVRVPVASVSSVDMSLILRNRPDDFLGEFRRAILEHPYLGWTDKPLVSTDLRSRPESLILAGPEIIAGTKITRIFGWYDNEWGFSNRMIDLSLRIGARLKA